MGNILERQVPEYWTIDWDRDEPDVIVRTLDASGTAYVSQRYGSGMSFTTMLLLGMVFEVDKVVKGRR